MISDVRSSERRYPTSRSAGSSRCSDRQNRRDAQQQARCLASSILSLQSQVPESEPEQSDIELETVPETEQESGALKDLDVRRASKVRGPEVRKWFARQPMLPEWMINVPDSLSQDWYVFARPAGKRCFVVSSNGTTVSRQRNGSILHHFPSALPNTPLVIVWKDENCSQYVIDTDSKGEIPSQQLVVLELQDDGKLVTSDDPSVLFGCLDGDIIEKVLFQFMVQHSPLKIDDLLASINSPDDQEYKPSDTEMVG